MGIQINQEELTKTIWLFQIEKTTLVFMVYTRIFQHFQHFKG